MIATRPSYNINEWIEAVTQLSNQVTQWSKDEGWQVQESLLSLEDQMPVQKGLFSAPELTIDTPYGRLHLEPVGFTIPGKGSVELSVWPSLYRVRLAHLPEEATWRVITDSGIPLHQEWNAQNFVRLAKDLLRAE